MFATGPANNCAVEFFTADSYGSIATLNGMENIRRLEVMLDIELLDYASSGSNLPLLTDSNNQNFCFIDLDYNGAVADPLSGLRAVVNRGSQKTATPNNTTPDFGKRIELWLKDDGVTVQFRTNGSTGTGVTYTDAEAAAAIVAPAGPITIGSVGANTPKMRLYEAAIRVNGALVFHVRPRLYMASTATPETIPDLSPYGNDLTIGGTLNESFRYIPSWSRQIPYAGRENVG